MKKEFRNITIISGICLIIIGSGLIFFGSADDFPEDEQILLVYDVLEWEDTIWGVQWLIWNWDYSESIYKGNFSSNKDGKIEVSILGYHEKNQSYEIYQDINYTAYGDISIYEKINNSYELNMTLTNISMNELGFIFIYGYINWNPGFKISLDWEINAQNAYKNANNQYVKADLVITNNTNSVTYDFQQIGGGQKTILTYNKTNGVLLEAMSEFGLYKSHIRLQGYTPDQQIPGYSIPLTMVSVLFGILIVLQRKRRNNKLSTSL